ncbi:endoglucanase type c [Fusarium phyllophilum]|uniref:Endoglucanase type c n=1 Tax=Fusarium phyllophilum TaxID=47803 RepID=A0A8H5NL31_9HYPO|nr:endoglucanase type c [Fusarium phyllophilum]
MGLLASNNHHQLHLSHLEHRVPMPRSLSAVSSLEIRDLNRDQIRFYHPGYLKPLNLLFCLPRVDYNTTEGAFGVHYLTALTACQIVANNAFEKGYLARDERGKDRVSGDETILLQRDYWFFVEGDDRYAIVPSFRDWQFPHDRLPEWWSVPTSRTSLYAKRCAVTNTSYAFTWAHLIPREEQSWFSKNGMGLYGGGSHTIDDPHNILPLKADLYVCFDQSVFALIPKQSGQANGVEANSQYVLHVLDGREAEFTALYQNRPVETLVEGSREYLFARFAWSIFSFLKPFLTSGVGRRVVRFRLRASDDDAEEEHLISEMQNVFLDSRKLESLYGGGHRRKTVSLEDSYVDVEDEWDDEHPGRTEMEG